MPRHKKKSADDEEDEEAKQGYSLGMLVLIVIVLFAAAAGIVGIVAYTRSPLQVTGQLYCLTGPYNTYLAVDTWTKIAGFDGSKLLVNTASPIANRLTYLGPSGQTIKVEATITFATNVSSSTVLFGMVKNGDVSSVDESIGISVAIANFGATLSWPFLFSLNNADYFEVWAISTGGSLELIVDAGECGLQMTLA
jgi:hypothetical protein